MAAIGRNDPCPCGSGRKYKKCCLGKAERMSWTSKAVLAAIGLILLIGALVTLTSLDEFGQGCPVGQVWSPEHGHCH